MSEATTHRGGEAAATREIGERERRLLAGREYIGVHRIEGPLIFVRRTHPVGYRELIECVDPTGHVRLGMVLETSEDAVVAQVFEGTSGLTLPETRVRFRGEPLAVGVTERMLGRVFNGLGEPIDDGPAPMADKELPVNGMPINPTAREYPRDFIQTGISAIDGMNTLIRGQKLPIFSGNGLPHNELAAQIARQAKIRGGKSEFAVVFAAMGVKNDVARFFITVVRGDGRPGERGAVPLARRRPFDRAHHHAAHRAHARGVPRLREEHARAGHPDRHVQLLREPPRDLDDPRRDPLAQGLPRLPLLGPRRALRALRDAQGLQRARSPSSPSSRCPTTTSRTPSPT